MGFVFDQVAANTISKELYTPKDIETLCFESPLVGMIPKWDQGGGLQYVGAILLHLTTIAIATGWRLQLAPSRSLSLAIGGLSGLAGGATGMSGVPPVLFWLGRSTDAAAIRSNIFIFLWIMVLIALALSPHRGPVFLDISLEAIYGQAAADLPGADGAGADGAGADGAGM